MADPTPSSAFVALDDGRYAATELTRGPWQDEHQHAGPPIALVARGIEQAAAARGLTHVARLTANLLRRSDDEREKDGWLARRLPGVMARLDRAADWFNSGFERLSNRYRDSIGT